MHVVFVQFGDYAEAERRFAAGGKEMYYAQRSSVTFVATLVQRFGEVTVLTLAGERPEERLPSGVRTLGIELYPRGGRSRALHVVRALERLAPDNLILGTPSMGVLTWALMRRVRVLPLFFDSFQAVGWKARARYRVLGRLLSTRNVEWVANHSLAASLDLVRIGVDSAKVLPFDWSPQAAPPSFAPKAAPDGDVFRLIYVGMLAESKGIGDVLEAVAELRARAGGRWSLTVVGRENQEITKRAADLHLGDGVQFRGLVPHDDIVPLMHEHDAVLVPSRHEYPEGLPATIYEGLCSRSPLVVSDHPMFRLKIQDRVNGVVFRASDVASLVQSLQQLRDDRDLYARLSRQAEETVRDYFCPLKYENLISAFLEGPEQARRQLSEFSIGTGRYGVTNPVI